MSETSSEATQLNLTVKQSSGAKFEISIAGTAKVSELKRKVLEKSEIPVEQQRLIYAGRVLKDHEEVGSYKIKDGQTIHLVKGAAPGGSTTSTSSTANTASTNSTTNSSSTPQVPTNIAAGQGSGNVLADLTGARYAGLAQLPSASMFGPDGGMGSTDQMLNMLDQPGVAEAMQQMLADPNMVEMMINSNPQLRGMAPQFREMMRSEQFRNMISNPQAIRQMIEMQRLMGGMGGSGGNNSFPAPGSTEGNNNNTSTNDTTSAESTTTTQPPPANPFAALLGGQGGATAGNQQQQSPLYNPALLQSLMGGLGGGQQQQQQEEDNRPPEVRYESQLAQLNELGFYDFDRNVSALRRSGGNVQGAIEALLDGQV